LVAAPTGSRARHVFVAPSVARRPDAAEPLNEKGSRMAPKSGTTDSLASYLVSGYYRDEGEDPRHWDTSSATSSP
jgi:hypothetical protein